MMACHQNSDDDSVSRRSMMMTSAASLILPSWAAVAIGCVYLTVLTLPSSSRGRNSASASSFDSDTSIGNARYGSSAAASALSDYFLPTIEVSPFRAHDQQPRLVESSLLEEEALQLHRQLSKHLNQLKREREDPPSSSPQPQSPRQHVIATSGDKVVTSYAKFSCDSMNDPNLGTKLSLLRQQHQLLQQQTGALEQQQSQADGIVAEEVALVDKCQFAKTCNEGEGVGFFASRLFCSSSPSYSSTLFSTIRSKMYTLVILLFLITLLLLLFRLLNSTTDEFFSPGLELFSIKLGLPPRFAGVTLLALGNGAPDVAATMNAILDSNEGYLMALGELTGTCMFVSGVILGVIVSLNNNEEEEDDDDANDDGESDGRKRGGEEGNYSHVCNNMNNSNDYYYDEKVTATQKTQQQQRRQHHQHPIKKGGIRGVPCQGPLLRDIAVLTLVCIVSMSYLQRGVVDYGFVYTLLILYVVYVLTVLAADIYHLFYHLPMVRRSESGVACLNSVIPAEDDVMEKGKGMSSITSCCCCCCCEEEEEKEEGFQKDREKNAAATICCSGRDGGGGGGGGDDDDDERELVVTEQTPLVATTPADHNDHIHLLHNHHHSIRDTFIEAMSNYSCDEGQQREEQIVIFHPHHAVHPHHENGPVFLRNIFRGGNPVARRGSVNGVLVGSSHSARQIIRKSVSDGITSFHSWSHCDAPRGVDTDNGGSSPLLHMTSKSSDEDYTQSIIESSNFEETNIPHISASIERPNSLEEALRSNIQEFKEHWEDFFLDIYCNEENTTLDVILLSIELPFTIIRKLTNPVPCDGYYCRPLVAVSVAFSPIWLWYYFNDQFKVDISSSYIGYVVFGSALLVGLIVMRFAPGGDGPMNFYMVVPLTLYGFAIAATWIDSIADKLVELLELFGILLEIPRTIMGLTVLAFGNSLQDLIANVSLSRKGLSTMAVTACLAGPIFNLCVGLGVGFMALLRSKGKEEIRVKVPSSIKTGFYFTIANCALIVFAGIFVGKGVVGKCYGYSACGLYLAYVVTSLYI